MFWLIRKKLVRLVAIQGRAHARQFGDPRETSLRRLTARPGGASLRATRTVVRSSEMKLTRTRSPRFDPSAKLPLYAQVAERLRALIDNDGLTPGSALPSESELQRRFRVSRATVRQALQEL